ncbi:MAG: DUF6804 family protein [Erythrobacter sp.]|nr:DUF6804 family protein [Erythrobacter sp.]
MILRGGNPVYPIRQEGVLAAGLLALALLDMPYGYFQFLRWLIMIIGISVAFDQIAQRQRWLFYFGLAVAVLFNPFFKVSFEREVWWWIDIILVGVFLLIGLTVRDETKIQTDPELIEVTLDDEEQPTMPR